MLDTMKTANRNNECDEIERFASGLGLGRHCTYNFDTKRHTLQIDRHTMTITNEEFQDKQWMKKVRDCVC